MSIDAYRKQRLLEFLERLVLEGGSAASADTHPKGGDTTQIVAPFMSGAVPKGDAQ